MTDPHDSSAIRAPSAPPATMFFIVGTLAVTWLMQLPAALATLHVIPGPMERYIGPAALGGFAPLVMAIVAARREKGRAGIRELFARFRIGGFNPLWFVFAVAMCGLVYVAGRGVYQLVAGSANAGKWLYLPQDAQHRAAMILVPIVEETGWRGFLQPRVQARFGPLRATFVVGGVWAAWHAMMFVVQSFSPFDFAIGMLNVFAGAFLFTWLFNRTRGSLLVAILAHVGAHLNNPTQALPSNPTPFIVYTVAVAVAAVAVVALDRKAWSNAVTTSAAT